MWTKIGERIEKLRTERNLSKAQFGGLLGVTGQYVGKIEKGSSLSAETIVNICRTMNVSADYILFGDIDSPLKTNPLKGLSNEQVMIALDILKRIAQLINTEDGNEALIQEVLRQQTHSAF